MNQEISSTKRDGFSSRFGIIAAAAGSVIVQGIYRNILISWEKMVALLLF